MFFTTSLQPYNNPVTTYVQSIHVNLVKTLSFPHGMAAGIAAGLLEQFSSITVLLLLRPSLFSQENNNYHT